MRRRVAIRHCRVASLAFVLSLVTACATSQLPARPVYEGIDRVGDVQAERIVGIWTATPLNPRPDQITDARGTQVHYRADGTVVSNVPAVPASDFDNAILLFDGRWHIEAGSVIHDDVVVSTRSRNTNALVLRNMLNQSPATARTVVNVFELEPDRMVLVGRDGVAMQYLRSSERPSR